VTDDDLVNIPDSPHAATLQQLDLISSKLYRLVLAQAAAEEQLFHRLAADYRNGDIDALGLHEIYTWCKARSYAEGFTARWSATMPDDVSGRNFKLTVYRLRKFTPDPDGNWRGHHPFGDGDRYPPSGTNVVYVLFDAENVPCYVGSTGDFLTRAKVHRKNGRKFCRYLAYPCEDREAAYVLEDRLLKEHQPYLNKRAGR